MRPCCRTRGDTHMESTEPILAAVSLARSDTTGLVGVHWDCWDIGCSRDAERIRRQSDYLRTQTEIQQTAARQWLKISNWKQHRVDSKDVMIMFEFTVENPTNAPLWVDLLMFQANGHKETSGLCSYLVPDTQFPWQFAIGLNQDEAIKFLNDGTVFRVELSAFFRDTFDNHWEQTFEGIIYCRHHNNFLLLRESRTRMRSSEVTTIPAPPFEDKPGLA